MTYKKGAWENKNYNKHQKSYERKQENDSTTRERRRYLERLYGRKEDKH